MEFTLSPPPNRITKGFFSLPREVRDVVYEAALVGPNRWERAHEATCPHCPKSLFGLAMPFFDIEPGPCKCWPCQHHRSGEVKIIPPCNCGKRKGLNLLRANKQINTEAAPIFWSKNKHTFANPSEFVNGVLLNLRDKTRDLITDVSIMPPLLLYRPPGVAVSPEHVRIIWGTLYKCKSIRSLELSPEYGSSGWCVRDHPSLLLTCLFSFTQLKSFRRAVLDMICLRKNPAGRVMNIHPAFEPNGAGRLRYLVAQEVNLARPITRQALLQRSGDYFATVFRGHVKSAIQSQVLHGSGSEQSVFQYTNGLTDLNPIRELKLRDNVTTTVHFLNLPPSQKTRQRNAKQRLWAYANDPSLGKQGKPTPDQQKEIVARQNTRKDESRGAPVRSSVEVRKERQETQREMEKAMQKTEKIKERQAREKSVAETKELKRMGRKRVAK